LVILTQYISSFITGFAFLITLFYAVPDLNAVTAQRTVFPLAGLYLQATSKSATIGLLCLCLLNTAMGVLGVFAIAGRQAWALARANEAPFSRFFGKLDHKTQAPFRAIAFVGVLSSGLGCLYAASESVFNAITGSFVVFLSLAYLGALLPLLLSGRKHIPRGPFWMPGPIGWIVNFFSCGYLIVFGTIFCFPSELPVTDSNMNYTIVIVVVWTVLASVWRLVKRGSRSSKDQDVNDTYEQAHHR
jgi:choline transport protein